MKSLFAIRTIMMFAILGFTSFSCDKKDNSVDFVLVPPNQPPVARAGHDRTIAFPGDSVFLDGTGSLDPNGDIANYEWRKITGPLSFDVVSPHTAQTFVKDLDTGMYQFELKVTDLKGLFSVDTVLVNIIVVPETGTGNVFFYIRDTTGGLDAENVRVIEGFYPRRVLVSVRIENYPDAEIEGVWCKNCNPRCPIWSNYVDETAFGTFDLLPGTYTWTAESVTTNLTGYPLPETFRQYWLAGPHKAKGTITVDESDKCNIKEIVFE